MRIAVIALGLMFTGISVPASAATTHSLILAVVIPVSVAAAAAYVAVRSWQMSLTLTTEAVAVQNLFRTYSLPLAEIAHASAGTYGIWITTRDGRRICASAVAKTNFEAMTGRRSGADEAAQVIADAAARSGLPVSSVMPTPATRRQLAVQAIIGVALLLGWYALMNLAGTSSAGARLLARFLGLAGLALVLIPALAVYQGFKDRRKKPPG